MKKRTKRAVSILLSAFMVFSVLSFMAYALADGWDGSAASGFAGGTGTQNDPYIIETAEQLAYLSASVNNSGNSYSGCYISLVNNIVLNSPDVFACDEQGRVTGKAEGKTARQWDAVGGFMPITITSEAEFNAAVSAHGSIWRLYDPSDPIYGIITNFDSSCTQYYYEAAFEGVFDGNGHSVSGIYTTAEKDCQGLFGQIKNATVKNVNVIGSCIEGRTCVGGIAGKSCNATVSNCFNTAAVNGTAYVGGIAGSNETGQIDNCCNSGSVFGTRCAGGITGENQGNNSTRSFIIDCRNRGTVSGEYTVGGVAGKNNIGTITGSMNSGYVNNSGIYGHETGGIAGANKSGIIENCHNDGRINGEMCVGGVAGSNHSYPYESIISRCCNTGDISGSSNIGGIAGDNCDYAEVTASVTDCYNIGSVSGGYGTGGVVGANIFFSCAIITRNYSVGSVPGANSAVGDGIGGVAGMCDYCGSGCISLEYPCTVGVYNCGYLSGGATEEQMRLRASYFNWDFETVWTMDGNPEYPYPELRGMAYGTAQAEAVTVSQKELNLVIGNTRQLSAEAANSGVVWLSSNDEVATVSDSGVVTAVAEGTAVITATATDGGFTDTCSVTVAPLTGGIKLSARTLQLRYKETVKITATVTPANAANKKVVWTSSNPDVATVDSKGNVTARSKGTSTITATTEDACYTASCTVTVKTGWVQWLISILLFGWLRY